MVQLVRRVPRRVRPGPQEVLDVRARPVRRPRPRTAGRPRDTQAPDVAARRRREKNVRRVGHRADRQRSRTFRLVAEENRVRPRHGAVLQRPVRVAGRRSGANVVRVDSPSQRRGRVGRIHRRQRRKV